MACRLIVVGFVGCVVGCLWLFPMCPFELMCCVIVVLAVVRVCVLLYVVCCVCCCCVFVMPPSLPSIPLMVTYVPCPHPSPLYPRLITYVPCPPSLSSLPRNSFRATGNTKTTLGFTKKHYMLPRVAYTLRNA